MSERPSDPSADGREENAGRDADAEADVASTLASAALGESVTADRLRDRLVGDVDEGDPARLLDVQRSKLAHHRMDRAPLCLARQFDDVSLARHRASRRGAG